MQGRYLVTLPSGPGGSVLADLRATLNDPARLRALGLEVAGNAELSGELQLESLALAGKARLKLQHLAHEVVQARNVEVQARASGTVDEPQVQADVTLDALIIGGVREGKAADRLAAKERGLLDRFRTLSPQERQAVLRLLKL